MRILGLVTARGGSKGLPGKNLAPIAGRPLVAWSHRALADLRSRLAEPGLENHVELIVRLSTDDADIAGAWPESDRPLDSDLRPAHLSTDAATSIAVVEYELERMADLGTPCDGVLIVQPTSPLLSADDLVRMVQAFIAGNPSVAAITPLDHPMHWNLTRDNAGRLSPAIESDASLGSAQRQRQPETFRPVGCYLCTSEFIADYRGFTATGITLGVEIPNVRTIDIDTQSHLDTARAHISRPSERHSIVIGEGDRARTIGDCQPCFVIAEAGVNHNGDTDLAHKLVDAAADSGADAVKFQTFRASELVTDRAAMALYQRTNLGVAAGTPGSQADMLRRLELSESAIAKLKAHAEERGLVFLSSPFDIESARLLAGLGVCALKLGSGELTNHPYLADLAELGLPLLLSTGMATLDEAEDAANIVRKNGNPPSLWFHCVSAYPAPASATNLRAIGSLRSALCAPIGMSDHSMGDAVALAAVARGAVAIEKHLTLSREMAGPDHAASLEPGEFAEMMGRIRIVESALGDGVKQPAVCEFDTVRAARRSLVAAADLPAGHTICAHDLVAKRPGDGVCPSRLPGFIGRKLIAPLARDARITFADIDGCETLMSATRIVA